MDPIVEAYFEAVKTADTQSREERDKLRHEHDEKMNAVSYESFDYYRQRNRLEDEYWRRVSVISGQQDTAKTAAWELLKTSENPLVVFIAEHCYEYKSHADEILPLLPADHATLRARALANGWCEVFDRFAAAAVRKKLLVDERTPTRRKLELHMHREYGARMIVQTMPLAEEWLADEIKRARKVWEKEQREKNQRAAAAVTKKPPKTTTAAS